jgi:ubiquinone/menaquinone biosynthesis C-methylase UbiE
MRSTEYCGSLFADVDGSDEVPHLARYLRAVPESGAVRDAQPDPVGVLGLVPGARALDVGCGLGDEVRAMAALVGPAGRAVGLDRSRRMLALARLRARREGVKAEFVAGDAHVLPFAAESFDAIRCERTLQYLADPARAVAEMGRVAAPGATITLSEPDWASLAIDLEPAAVSEAVCDAFRSGFPQPVVGRTLVRLLVDAGFQDVEIDPGVLLIREADKAETLLELRRVTARALAPKAAEEWLEGLHRAAAEKTLFITATGFLATARKPGG